jgi:hypothetical protein
MTRYLALDQLQRSQHPSAKICSSRSLLLCFFGAFEEIHHASRTTEQKQKQKFSHALVSLDDFLIASALLLAQKNQKLFSGKSHFQTMKIPMGIESVSAALLLLGFSVTFTCAFTHSTTKSIKRYPLSSASVVVVRVSRTAEADDFSSFAASLEQDAALRQEQQRRATTSGGGGGSESSATSVKTWQTDLERLLDPSTSPAQRQILVSDLLNANAEIRASVETALRDRKVRLSNGSVVSVCRESCVDAVIL